MEQKCIICNHPELKPVLEIKNSSSSVAKLLDKDMLATDSKVPISLVMCPQCQLCQLKSSDFVDEDFYEEYKMNVFFSRQSQDYQKQLAIDFVNYFGLAGKKAFEIGCGDGVFASFLTYQGLETIGIEPSKSFFELAKERISVLNQYFDAQTSLEKNYYDAFVAKEVFEHLKNPNQILQAAKLFLKPDGVGLISVPSFATTLKDNRYYDIFRDHVAYYTKYTLQYLLSINNFEIVRIFPTAGQEYLTVYFRNSDYQKNEVKLFSENFAKFKQSVREFLAFYQDKKVAVWGAGGRGIEFLSMYDIGPQDILFVIDSNPDKWNQYTPGSHILIKSPTEVNFNDLDLIIISAVLY